MGQVDLNAFATTGTNTAATTPNLVESQQPAGAGSVRQVFVLGDPLTRANLQKTTAAGEALVTQLDTASTSTSLSATDILAPAPSGNGVLINTAPTAGSFVAALVTGGAAQCDIQILGTATGIYYFEASMDSTTGSDGNWIATNYRQTGITNTVLGYSTVTGGVYRGAPSGFKYIRVRNVGGTTPTNALIFRFSNGSGTTFLNASIPAGTNPIGKIVIDQTTNVVAGTVMQTAAVALGNGTNLNVQGYVSAIISVTGTMGANTAIAFEASVDDTTFVPITGHQIGLSGNLAPTTTNTGDFRFSCAAYKSIRARISVFGTGSVNAKGYVSALAGHSTTVNANLIAALPAGTNLLGNVGITGTALVSQKAATSTSATLQVAAVATGNGTVISTDGMSAVVFTVSGTYVGTITFEGTEDGTNYTSISTTQLGTTIIGTTTTTTGVFEASVAGLLNVRARLTWASGTSVTVTAHAVPVNFATRNINANIVSAGTLALDSTQTNGTAQSKITDGTTIANNVAGDTGQNALTTVTARKEVSYSTAIVATVATTDVSNHRWVSVQLTSIGTSSVHTFQISNDNATWYPLVLSYPGNPTNTPISNSGGGLGIYHGPIAARYFRVNVTGISAGTASGVIEFFAAPQALVGTAVAGNSNVNINTISGLSAAIADATTNPSVPPISAYGQVFNGTTWDRLRGNETVTLLASAARTVTATSADLINYNGRSIIDIILDMTVVGTGSITVTINGKDPASGKYYLLLSGAAIVANSTNVYTLNPNLATSVANVSAQKAIPRIFQIVVTANNANTATYSVGYNLMRG